MNRHQLLNRGVVLFAALLALAAAWMKGADGVQGLLWGARTVLGGPLQLEGTGQVNLGVYDPGDELGGSDRIALDHSFISWLDFDAGALRREFDKARARNRWLMVTIEPFAAGGVRGFASLLGDTVDGRYDAEIDAVCGALDALAFPVLVRWGHEMETPTGRYPWAQSDASAFIAAYRHFVDRCRQSLKDVYFVWSPRGDAGMERYFPGRPYAQYVGVSVYALPAFDIDVYGRTRSFAESFGEKYERARQFDLPVMIAEMGVEGSPRYRRVWLDELKRSLGRFPSLRTIVLFNALEPEGVYPEKYGRPDWRIEPALLD